jgi:hypothetical protein
VGSTPSSGNPPTAKHPLKAGGFSCINFPAGPITFTKSVRFRAIGAKPDAEHHDVRRDFQVAATGVSPFFSEHFVAACV